MRYNMAKSTRRLAMGCNQSCSIQSDIVKHLQLSLLTEQNFDLVEV